MARNRKCILCETVYVSRQEMEEHMRSMLHHRELENLKGRDCGHECRVCKVTVVSLTDYASHISSPKHKQNVEDFERISTRHDHNEGYFDKALVELIEKRNAQIRKEKEAAAAKRAREEAERKKKEEFQQRLKETKERFRLELQQQSNLYNPQNGSWNKWNQYGTNPGHMQNVRPWQQSKWGKSSSWHAQDPPNFKNFNKVPPPWISNAGSSNGVYGCNNISQNVRPVTVMGQPSAPLFPSLPKFFTKGVNQFQNGSTNQGAKQKPGPKGAEKKNTEAENSNDKGSNSFGSDPKFDKTCRWSPYHVNNKESESMPNLVQKNPKSQNMEKSIESGTSKPDQRNTSGESSNNSSRSSSLQRDVQKNTSINTTATTTPCPPANKRAKVPAAKQVERKASLGAGLNGGAQVNKPSSQNNGTKGLSKSDRQLPETVKKVKQLEKMRSLDSLSSIGQKTTQVQELKPVAVNKENTVKRQQAKPSMPALSKPAKPSSDQSLQHLHVSTSSACPIPNQEGEKIKNNIEKESFEDKLVYSSEESDFSKSNDPQNQSAVVSKLDLPPVFKRDLTKHMISNKAKSAVSLEPNLNIARRVRNLSESKKSDSDKDSGLKPTVRQLLSSSGSRRNVNWDQVYHEVRKKQDKGKGMPRFGIEMVSMDQEDHSQEEDDFMLLQDFSWDSLLDSQTPPASRKRSLSESSIAPLPNHAPFLDNKVVKSEPQDPFQETDLLQEIEMGLCAAEEGQRAVKARQRADSATESVTEIFDGQGTAKKRRATRDVPHPETSYLEHHIKRRKIKSKKVAERTHIEELLAVSLREDELSRSLLSLDTDLIKARAALEAAFVEVQRLMMSKQQTTTEMATLRSKRIELLKGMKDAREEAPELGVKEERRDESDLSLSSTGPSITDSSTPLCETTPCASTRAPCGPFTPLAVKEEPRSPVNFVSEQDSAVGAHSTTPELPITASAPEAATYSLQSPERWSELCQSRPEPEQDEFGDPVDSKESLADLVLTMTTEKGNQASQANAEPSTNDKLLSPRRKDSEKGSFVESAAAPSFEIPSLPPGLNVPASPSELRGGKKVRKLKKRKLLKKAQSSEVPESSDTEMDTDASRQRCPRPRRRSSGGSQVSTSNQQTEERGEDVKMDEAEALLVEKEDSQPPKSSKKHPCVTPSQVTVKSEPQKNTQESLKPESQNVACHEVSSTSDMDISPAPDSDVQGSLTLPKVGKTSSDVSSDHGEDDLPTEGAFEGHAEAVNSIQIHGGLLYTCSGDRTVRAFDIVSHKCVAVFEGHSSKVNALSLSTNPSLHHRLYTGSSDQTIRCYSLMTQKFEEQFSLSDRVLCLHSRWKIMFAGLGNGTVVTFNLKTNRQMDVFECHGPRAVSCLASSQEGARRLLLVGSYDNTISVRDAKNGLLLRTLEGHSKTVLCMKVVNDLVYSGSSDQCVYAHNIHSGQLVQVYKGHSHAVSVVCVLGKVMVTACLDKLIRVYDLQAHEQLQVYGGHNDMVMCMTLHKNMIYTGCYDGSVQAYKLNLMQNYHCRWHGCSLVFGVLEHLEHHLSHDHTSPNLQTLRCRWKNCEEFFSARISSKKAMLLHMQKHAAEESQEP
ncbi:zinc finger protein 106 isoform X2 [Eucyclogobius newberryi]|uniref:zinc finger protein 106 isoform X2 n=1 Tax=Eucyclogobius newberryi TaxID=166745 RepID=UPI003B596B0F